MKKLYTARQICEKPQGEGSKFEMKLLYPRQTKQILGFDGEQVPDKSSRPHQILRKPRMDGKQVPPSHLQAIDTPSDPPQPPLLHPRNL